MKIIENRFIPTKRYVAINIFGFLFCRDKSKINDLVINHEKIHTYQQYELMFIFFYIWYGIELLINLFKYKNFIRAYYNISFELEAYYHDKDMEYLQNRKLFAFTKYL